jgi:hypothetical protein
VLPLLLLFAFGSATLALIKLVRRR